MENVEVAKPAVAEIELSTGVMHNEELIKKITYRELAGPEEDLLASNMSTSSKMTKVMANCVMTAGSLVAPRDYGQILKVVEKMLITDRWLFLVALRCLSLGNLYKASVSCPNCQKDDVVEYDMRDMKVINAPDATKVYRDVKLSSGRLIRMKAGDGRAEQIIEKMANDQNAPTVGLFARITEVDNKPVDLVAVKNMTLKERAEIRKELDALEGEFDDEMTVVCHSCNHEYKTQLQLSGAGFFSL